VTGADALNELSISDTCWLVIRLLLCHLIKSQMQQRYNLMVVYVICPAVNICANTFTHTNTHSHIWDARSTGAQR